MNQSNWSAIEEKGTLLGMSLLFGIYRFFGRIPFMMVLYPVVLYYFLFSASARDASIFYLSRVKIMNGHLPAQSLYRLSFRHFLTFAEGLLDKLIAWMGAINYEHVSFADQSKFFDLMDRGQGAIIIGSHLGNLEVMHALSKYNKKIRLNILVHTKHAEKFNRILRQAEPSSQLSLMQVSDITPATALLMKDKVDAGEFIVIVGDRVPVASPSARNRTSSVDFLGEPADFAQGPLLIAAILKCPVYTLFCLKREKQYEIQFSWFSDRIKLNRTSREADLKACIQQYANILQEQTLRAPFQWFNFYPYWQSEQVDEPKPGATLER